MIPLLLKSEIIDSIEVSVGLFANNNTHHFSKMMVLNLPKGNKTFVRTFIAEIISNDSTISRIKKGAIPNNGTINFYDVEDDTLLTTNIANGTETYTGGIAFSTQPTITDRLSVPYLSCFKSCYANTLHSMSWGALAVCLALAEECITTITASCAIDCAIQ